MGTGELVLAVGHVLADLNEVVELVSGAGQGDFGRGLHLRAAVVDELGGDDLLVGVQRRILAVADERREHLALAVGQCGLGRLLHAGAAGVVDL